MRHGREICLTRLNLQRPKNSGITVKTDQLCFLPSYPANNKALSPVMTVVKSYSDHNVIMMCITASPIPILFLL